MNKKKLIFLIGLGILVIIIIIGVIFISKATKENKSKKTKATNFNIWLLETDKDKFNSFLEQFKKDTGNSSLQANIETFDNYKEYNLALASAIIKGEAPDLYMLNNNEKSIFLENAIGINPENISPDELRKSFYPFFGDDLIYSSGEKEQKTEFLVGVPFGYETLGLYFNFRRVQDIKKMKNFSMLENLIEDFHNKRPDKVALGIGAGTTVENSGDIFTQFLMSIKNSTGINDITSTDLKQAFTDYFYYNKNNNNFQLFEKDLKSEGKTNLDYFVDGKIAMIFGYPRLVNKIAELGFKKSYLKVANFPEFINDTNMLVNYNYFVINKNSKNIDMSLEILKYIFSEKGEKALLKEYPYYLPARISVYSEMKNNVVNDDFYVKLKDFYNPEANYSSFDKGIKNEYEKIVEILDKKINYINIANKFFNRLQCMTKKILKLEDLSKTCEQNG